MNRLFIRPVLATLCATLFCIGGSNAVFANEEESFPEVMRVEETSTENLMQAFTDNVRYANDTEALKRIHNDGYYHLVAYSDTGDVIQLHDASKWQVERSGRQKVLRWITNDQIWIKPCVSCWSSYNYVLHNRTTNQTVEVNLINPPLPMGQYTYRITNIEPYKRLVLLSDNTVWQMGSNANFSYWQVGQRVIVGVNNKWRSTQFPHILINVDVSGEPYSEALFYGYPAN